MKALHYLLKTDNHNSALLIARVTLGVVMFPHGAQKALGWFGGHGFSATMGYFTQQHVPALLAFLVIVAEFAGALGLVVGALSRVAAFGITAIMIVATFTVHAGNGFFMNWYGAQKGEGFEYHLLALGLSLIVLLFGAGRASLDTVLAKKFAKA